MIVCDASVIAKWVLKEEDSERAKQILKSHLNGTEAVAIPDLAIYEIGNVLVTKKNIHDDDLVQMFNYVILAKPVIYRLGINQFIESIKLARELQISLYDSVYIVLAKVLNTYLVTADKKLAVKASKKTSIKLL